jgi:RND family efflux transporter MFP subunit
MDCGEPKTETDKPMSRVLLLISTMLLVLCCHTAYGQSRSSRLQLNSGNLPDGVLEPWRICDVACSETGIVKSIAVKIGAKVQTGDLLAELNSDSLILQLAAAEVQATNVGRRNAAHAEVELNERRVEAIRTARGLEFSSQSELDRAEADLKISRGRLTAELEENELLILQVARLKQQLAQRSIEAPFAGIVVELHKEVGEYVAPNTPEVVRIVDVSRLRTSFFLRANEVAEIAKNEKVQVRLSDGTQVEAELEHIAPVADSESALIEVRVLVNNPKQDILSSRCSLILNTPPAA